MKYLLAAAMTCAATVAGFAHVSSVSGLAGDRHVQATLLNSNIVRVTNIPRGQTPPAPQVVLDLQQQSPLATSLEINLDANGILTITDTVNGITITDNGDRRTADGLYTLQLVAAPGNGSFYGAGERGHKMNLRGDTLVNYNRQNYGYTGTDPRLSQMNITMPVVVSSQGYAILFDDFAASTMVLGDTISYTTEAPVPVTYYYIGGVRNLADLTQSLTQLTGRQPLPPLWAMGYINSKYGYKSPAETLAAVDSLKALGYPLDGTVLDLYWFGKEQDMGFLDWDRTVWPDPAAMMDSLKARGVNLVTVSEPYILTNGRGLDNYRALAADTMMVRTVQGDTHPVTIWVGEGGMFDVSNPRTRSWLADRYRMLTDLGIGGWWGDLGEPEVHPQTGVHANGLSARQYHNRYGNDWASIIKELYDSVYPDTRLMTLMRGGTTGLQRQSVFPWSTDVSRSWGGLEPQVRIMLHSGLSGLGYMSSDLGGFAVDEANPYIPELYLRWVQMGVFNPVFRTHAQQYAEPYNYPMYGHLLPELARERYRWLPYNYTLAYENASKGWPLVRPLNFHGPLGNDYDAAQSSEYLWGRDVLVAPVLSEGTRSRTVLFPRGSDWYSRDGLNVYRGGQASTVAAPLEAIPMFVRAGAVIATAPGHLENTAQYRADSLKLSYYPGPVVDQVIYDDDHVSPSALLMGNYRLLRIAGATDSATGVTNLSISTSGTYPGAPQSIHLDFVLLHAQVAATVAVDGVPVDALYHSADHTVTFSLDYVPGTTVHITATPHI